MKGVNSQGSRYSLTPLFLIAVFFIGAAPLFWHRVELGRADRAFHSNDDLYEFYYPAYHYGFGRMRSGEIPLWNSRQLCGVPFQADPRTGLFQPLHAVFLVMPTERAMAVHAFLCLFLMGSFFALFARGLGVAYVPALIGGIAYAFCGASAAAMSRPPLASALAWTPFMFWGICEWVQRFRVRGAVAAGLGAALVVLSGAPVIACAMFALALPYAVLETFSAPAAQKPSRVARAAGWGVMAAVAVTVSAIQWAPTVAWTADLARPWELIRVLRVAGHVPWRAGNLAAHLLTPAREDLPAIGYMGIAAMLLLPAALFHRRNRRDMIYFGLTGLVVLLAFSRVAPLPALLPWTAWAFPAMVCFSTLTALGADRLLADRDGHGVPRVWVPASLVLLAACGLFLVSEAQVRGYIIAFVAVSALLTLVRTGWMAAACGLVVATLLFADLSTTSVNMYLHPFQDAPQCYERYRPALALAEEQGPGARVVVSARPRDKALPENLGMIAPVHVVGGQDIPQLRGQALFWERLLPLISSVSPAPTGDISPGTANPSLLSLMSGRIFLVGAASPIEDWRWMGPGPSMRPIEVEGDAQVFSNEDALPRAYWVPHWRVVDGVDRALDVLTAPEFDPASACTVDRRSPGFDQLEALTPPRAPETATALTYRAAACSLEERSAERLVVRVDAPRSGVTVLADTFARGWRASLDGEACPILRVNGMFRGIVTPPGPHEIVFEYRPLSFFAGCAVTLMGLAACAVLAGAVRVGCSTGEGG